MKLTAKHEHDPSLTPDDALKNAKYLMEFENHDEVAHLLTLLCTYLANGDQGKTTIIAMIVMSAPLNALDEAITKMPAFMKNPCAKLAFDILRQLRISRDAMASKSREAFGIVE